MAKVGTKRLDHKQVFELTNLIKSDYTARGLSDEAFAAAAAEELGFHVHGSSIGGIRKLWGIAANNVVNGAVGRMAAIELRLARAEEQIATILRERSEHHIKGLKP